MYWQLQNFIGVELDFENENNWQWILNYKKTKKLLKENNSRVERDMSSHTVMHCHMHMQGI